MKKRIAIIGATSTIAEHCAREWIKPEQVELVLVGRNEEQLKIIAQDLLVRAPKNECNIMVSDFTSPQAIKQCVQTICAQGTPDIVLIAHGTLPEQQQCQHDLLLCQETLEINGISPVLFAEAFAEYMDKEDKGTIAIIGSVAGDRGRQSNYVYGAAKGLVARYAQGLQHRFHGRHVKVVLIKPGPTATKMTAKLSDSGTKLADAAQVANIIVQGVAKGKAVIYAPKQWALIMMIIRHIPAFIFGKMKI